jgi:hypothetical protein
MRPINELRMRARWKLGSALAVVERATHPGKGKLASASLTSLLTRLALNRQTALEAQRIAALPDEVLAKAFALWRQRNDLLHYTDLIDISRPYWAKVRRQIRHRNIHAGAVGRMVLAHPGPFPLIYADPPWKFEIYSDLGLERTPDQHYPTLSYEEIRNFCINGVPMSKIAHNPEKSDRAIATERKKIAERIKKLQPKVSNRQIAKVLGTGKDTINRDVGANAPAQRTKAKDNKADKTLDGANAPSALSGAAAAKAVESKETKEERKEARLLHFK